MPFTLTNLLVIEFIMCKTVFSVPICFILLVMLVGCHNPDLEPKSGPSSNAANHELQRSAPKIEPDPLDGKWSWPTAAIPTVLTRQIASIKCSRESISGQIIWLLDEKYVAEIVNGKKDRTKVSFDATFVQRDVKVKFSYSGTLEGNGTKISGSVTISGTEAGKAVKRQEVWIAVPEP